jgi:hypothetical protein
LAKKILWLSRHRSVQSQFSALQRLFGADVAVDHRDFGNAEQAAEVFRRGGYDDLVAVVPLATLDHLCRQRLKPLWCEAVEERDPRHVEYRGADNRGYRFDRFARVTRVSLDLAPVDPLRDVRRVLRVTDHTVEAAELAELRRLFGVRSGQVVTRFVDLRRGAPAVVEAARRENADEVILAAPYSVFDALCRSGRRPLYALYADGAFVSLHRIQGVTIKREELP